jgi:hypothetical protein
MTLPDNQTPHKESLLRRVATVEGWLGLAFAIGTWLYAMRPLGPMVGMPLAEFIRGVAPLLPTTIGIALGISGIRHGNHGARITSWWAIALLLPLLALIGVGAVMRSF